MTDNQTLAVYDEKINDYIKLNYIKLLIRYGPGKMEDNSFFLYM